MNARIQLCCCLLLMMSQSALTQVHLTKAVVSESGGTASNGAITMNYTVGQAATGTASHGNVVGEFGFWTGTSAILSVAMQDGAGIIQSMALSPNPATSDARINLSLAQRSTLDLLLYDASGKLVSTIFSGTREAGNSSIPFSTKELPSGTYFVAARTPGALLQTQVTIIR